MLRPARGICLVRKAETEETLPGGKIIIPQDSRERFAQYQVEIVAVGEPEICENKRCARRHERAARYSLDYELTLHERWHVISSQLKPGAWALVRPRSFVEAGSETGLYFVRHDDVLGIFSAPEPPAGPPLPTPPDDPSARGPEAS